MERFSAKNAAGEITTIEWVKGDTLITVYQMIEGTEYEASILLSQEQGEDLLNGLSIRYS